MASEQLADWQYDVSPLAVFVAPPLFVSQVLHVEALPPLFADQPVPSTPLPISVYIVPPDALILQHIVGAPAAAYYVQHHEVHLGYV